MFCFGCSFIYSLHLCSIITIDFVAVNGGDGILPFPVPVEFIDKGLPRDVLKSFVLETELNDELHEKATASRWVVCKSVSVKLIS